nr:hypothetical protein [Pedobacter nutrimenti]
MDRNDAALENSGKDVNPIVSLALIRQVMDLALDLSNELGEDRGRQAKWRDILARLGDYPQCNLGELPIGSQTALSIPENRTLPIFRYSEIGCAWQNGNAVGIQHCTIQEMLFQSYDGVLRLFPNWPKNQDARFGTLRARGAFLVSARQKGGIISGVKVFSEKGRDCTVANPWRGHKVRVSRKGKITETVSGECFMLKTSPQETLVLNPL